MLIPPTEYKFHYCWCPLGDKDKAEIVNRKKLWRVIDKKDQLINGLSRDDWGGFNRNSSRKVLHILGHGGKNDANLYGEGNFKISGVEMAHMLERYTTTSNLQSLDFINIYTCYGATNNSVAYKFAAALSANVKIIASEYVTYMAMEGNSGLKLDVPGYFGIGKVPYADWFTVVQDKTVAVAKVKLKSD